MRLGLRLAVVFCLGLVLCPPAYCGRVEGVITQVTEYSVTATFPARIKDGAAMMILSGQGESIAGMATVSSCKGEGPFTVCGEIRWLNDVMNVVSGKKVYVNSFNANAIPSTSESAPKPKATFANDDLKLYYYLASENIGYGAVGVGYERSMPLADRVALEADAGITAVGSVDSEDTNRVDASQLIKSLNGRLKVDLGSGVGVYTSYRWSEGRGDDDSWYRVADKFGNLAPTSTSNLNTGTVELSGFEYGLSVHPYQNMRLSFGFMPELQADYGGIGVFSQTAYTGELRFSTKQGAIRLRGIRSTDGSWLADLGITIK